jgi:DNA-binding transcriptional LysR family regulator
METNRLRQFKVVSETQNLRRASEMLNMSHSALSKSLKVLSTQIGKDLLIQRGRNIVITDYGRNLLVKIDAVLSAEEDLMHVRQDRVAAIRIATFEVFSTHLLGHRWNRYFPSESLELRELLPGQLERAIVDNISDFGITYEPIPVSGLEFTLIGEIEMGIYGLKEKFAQINFNLLPFVAPISPISGTPSGAKGLDGWPDDEFQRFVKYRVDMMETGLALARTGNAVIFSADFVIRHHNVMLSKANQIEIIQPPKGFKKIRRKVFLVSRKTSLENTIMRRLAKLIRSECI